MPTTYREIMAQVFETLLQPHPAHPDERIVYRHLKQNVQLLFNQALNQPPSWDVASIDLNVDETRDTYQITAGDFGKDTLVHTVDDSDPNHVERPINRMSLQSSLIDGAAPYAWGVDRGWPFLGYKHSANTFVFYREAGSIFVKLLPKPAIAATYRIWYETSEPSMTLGDNLILPQGESLLCLRVAFSCLPGTSWCGKTEAENREKRKELAVTLAADKADHELQWRHFTATDRNQGRGVMRGFDDEEYAQNQF